MLSAQEALTIWDLNLTRFEDYSYSQTRSWGDYRGCFGWQPYRWAAFTDMDKITAMMQGLLRKYPGGFGILWVPGGPVGDISAWNRDLQQMIVKTTGIKRLYCRISPTRSYRAADALALKSQGWIRSYQPMLSGMSMLYQCGEDEQSRLESCSGNWRHNLRRSRKFSLSIERWSPPNIDSMMDIYNNLQEYKDISEQYSRRELDKIFEIFGDKIVLYCCTDEMGDLIAFRGCALIGEKAWDLFAATTVKGRNLYASYPLLWKVIEHCINAGITSYDMGGIDPHMNEGVYHFKKGTGAKEIEYLGEWEWAASETMRFAVNCAIRYKAGRI
jgi:lipid II:glycine glycyltransferase (peptidoglycan interpeptide bridge formation enzyme)